MLGLAGLVVVGGLLVPPANRPTADAAHPPAATVQPSPPATPPTPAPTPSPTPVLQLAGPVPSTGSGSFVYATGRGSVFGRAGQLRRYRVAVERGSDEDVDEFATIVDATLADPGSWIGSGRLRLQRVAGASSYDFTIYLVTAGTARQMCAAAGVDIRVNGRPYTSCRTFGKVIINLDRWRRSVPHYVAAKVPLEVYRQYVINHEVGHELGYQHQRCPGKGRRAPVMMQQTLFLDGCVANPWPYVRGRRYSGPPL